MTQTNFYINLQTHSTQSCLKSASFIHPSPALFISRAISVAKFVFIMSGYLPDSADIVCTLYVK